MVFAHTGQILFTPALQTGKQFGQPLTVHRWSGTFIGRYTLLNMFWPFKRGEPHSGQFTSAARDELRSVFFDFELRLKNAKYESAKSMSRIAAHKRINSMESV